MDMSLKSKLLPLLLLSLVHLQQVIEMAGKGKSKEYKTNTFGPIVTFTASATSETPCSIAARAPTPKPIAFAP